MSAATATVLPFEPPAHRSSRDGGGPAYALVILPDATGLAVVPAGDGLAQTSCDRAEMLNRLDALLNGLGLAIVREPR
ncbi:hypothetical protein [Sinorhizobium medicae]|uniref:hypothetical protein n=1 Tax=Sinorhizobium medicae TaxID=110321 RepID=UPI000FE096B4|nr:hypothetical protein [Sinorhizobium medicae]RVJ00081.1 hypothetical protein CN183_27495 [Sinorhizobium medicae]